MKKLISVLSFCLPFFATAQIKVQKNYFESIVKFQRYYNNQNADSLYAMFSPQMKAALPVTKTKEMLVAMKGQIGQLQSTEIAKQKEDNVIYRGVFEQSVLNISLALNERNELVGLYFMPAEAAALSGKNNQQDSSNYNITIKSGASVFGTLLMPESSKLKHNIVLFIAGSGPTDRNCNNDIGVGTNAFKMLADSLQKAGIASVRFDKRGVGESKAAVSSEADLRFDDYVSDVVVFLKKIKTDPRFNKVIILGHSEGSLIGMIAANQEKADGYISLSGAGESADIILSRQIKANIPDKALEADSVLQQIKKGNQVKITNKYLMSLLRPSVQPYMTSWFAYDPQKEVKKLKIPVLILQGNLDLQVSENDAQLLQKAQPNANLVLIPQMNHVLKTTTNDRNDNLASYNNLSLPVSAKLSHEIINFCQK